MAKEFQLADGETLVKEDKGILRVGKIRIDIGRIYLTDQRLVFEKGGAGTELALAGIFGGIGGLFGAKMAQKGSTRLKVNSALTDIVDVQRTKFGRNENMMRIETGNGEVYEIGIDKAIDDWIEAISSG